jgi:hypothetical protein
MKLALSFTQGLIALRETPPMHLAQPKVDHNLAFSTSLTKIPRGKRIISIIAK